ncbi:MAG: hypothetical protein FWF66_00850 [Candidatus Bathyarchaeota archaeon]|nr:hypothetical protein [Candidatus Termiticorpusculum sp.]
MTTNTNTRFSIHNKKALLIASVLLVILLVTSLFVYNVLTNGVRSEMELRTAINIAPFNTPTTITLKKDISLTGSTLEIPKNKNIILVSDKKEGFWKLIGSANQATILVNGKLTLDGVIVTHKGGVKGSGVYVNFGGTLMMTDGIICNNIADFITIPDTGDTYGAAGGGVFNCGSFNMYGGVITNNTAYVSGGGVYNNGYDFSMFGGEISCNTANYSGGGIYNYNGIIRVYDGNISGNNAIVGGVCIIAMVAILESLALL